MDKATYPNNEIVVRVGCPFEYFEYLTAGWTTFAPEVHLKGYHYYRKCDNWVLLLKTLPGVTICKVFKHQATEVHSELLVNCYSPVRVIYNHNQQVLALSFFHEPVNSDENWYPNPRVEEPKASSRSEHWRDASLYPQQDGFQFVWHPPNEDTASLMEM